MCPEERSPRKFLYQKILFCKMLPGIEGKNFGLLGKLFPARLSSFRSTFAEERFREKFLKKKSFFIVSRLGAKNRLLKGHQDEYQNFILRVRWIFFRKNILFKVIWYISSGFLSKNIVIFEKNFSRLVKIAFYMSRGTSWWNYFCSLKTFFNKVFGLRVKTFSLISSAFSQNLPPTSPEVLSINFFPTFYWVFLFWNLSPKFSVLIFFFPAGSSKMQSESPEESFEGIHKFWGNMLSLSFFADFQWIF